MSQNNRRQNLKRRGRGEGAIYQRGDGRWCASVSAGRRGDGKRRRVVLYGATKKEVQDKLRKAQNEGITADTEKMLLKDYLVAWVASVKSRLAPTTHLRYEQICRLQITPHVGHVRLDKMAPLHVEQLFIELGKAEESASAGEKAGRVLHTAMRDAVRLKLIPYNPCSEIAKPRVAKKEMLVLDSAQVAKLLEESKTDRLYALYVLAVASGMRQGELFGLAWTDIDFDTGSVMVQRSLEELKGKLRLKETKSVKGRRRIDLPQFAIDALQGHRKRMMAEGHAKAPVFCDMDGGYLRRPNVQRRSFRPLLKRAELPTIRFHDLRHTSATLLLLQGVHPKIVSERLGHASIELTINTYSHVLPTLQREAADKLERMFG